MLITIGGDHGIPIPIMRALPKDKSIVLIQVDAHMDWRDEVNGEKEGYSSGIRRASEMDHIGEIFQIGLRGVGSGRHEEFESAKNYGAHLISAYEVHELGIKNILERIPEGPIYLTIDADGLDPTIMPAVNAPTPGGLNWIQIRELIHGLVSKGRVLGMDLVEISLECQELIFPCQIPNYWSWGQEEFSCWHICEGLEFEEFQEQKICLQHKLG